MKKAKRLKFIPALVAFLLNVGVLAFSDIRKDTFLSGALAVISILSLWLLLEVLLEVME